MSELTFSKLVQAYKDCRRHKRNTKAAIEFEYNLEENLLKLYEDLKTGKYEISGGICFVVTKPKIREVWAASFRDRIVHHLVYNEISGDFYKRFIKDTYSCIPKRGTLNAVKQLQKYCLSASKNYTEKVYYLKADIENFFVSIDKDILFKELEKYVKEEWLLDLLKLIVYHDPKKGVELRSTKKLFALLPKHKSLWHTPISKGLPIGNLTSQFFSNIYLNIFDQFVKHKLRCKFYCRYVDDFIVLNKSAKSLNKIHKSATKFLDYALKLKLHQKKKTINLIIMGLDFVGYVLKPNRMFLRYTTIRRIFLTVKNFYYTEKPPDDWIFPHNFIRSIESYFGFLKPCSSFSLIEKISALCFSPFLILGLIFGVGYFNFLHLHLCVI